MTPGTLFIISAPSGAGKTTLVRALLEAEPGMRLSVSYTTRPPRPGELDGVAYHFVTTAEFMAMRAEDAFVESAEVHGNFYGTGRDWLDARLSAGDEVILEIDIQGARLVRAAHPNAVSIFVLAPSPAELERRLRGRGDVSADSFALRVANARREMAEADCYDYVIINDRLESAVADLLAIVRSSRLVPARQRRQHPQAFLPS